MPRRRRRLRFRRVPRGYRWYRLRRAIGRRLFHRRRQARHHHELPASEDEARIRAERIVEHAQQQARAIIAAATAEAAEISAEAERLSEEFVGRLSAVAGREAKTPARPNADAESQRVEPPPLTPPPRRTPAPWPGGPCG